LCLVCIRIFCIQVLFAEHRLKTLYVHVWGLERRGDQTWKRITSRCSECDRLKAPAAIWYKYGQKKRNLAASADRWSSIQN
jgi:hypothetical protein